MSTVGFADVEPRRAGANLSVDVCLGGDWYNLTLSPADLRNPRVDRITATGSVLQVWNGTPTPGADLRNRCGLAALPEGHVDIGYVWVRQGAMHVASEHVTAAWIDGRLRAMEDQIRGGKS